MCDMMPSRDVMTSAAAAAAAAEKPKLLSLDVEHLVSEIKENLRLSGFKSRRNRTTHFARVKPYTTRPAACESCAARRPCRCDDDDDQANDDPYEMLQALLREGSLIKEAVRRLQIGLSPKQSQDGKFSLGEHTLEVPMELYKLNRERLCKRLSEVVDKDAYVLLQGGSHISHYCTDVDYIFRQEPYFHWTFGVSEPDCYGLIHVSSGEAHLFFPRVEEAHTVWLGKPLSLDEYKCRYKVNYASYVDTLGETLNALKPSLILILHGKNTDSDITCKEAHFEGIDRFTLDNKILHKIIADCRVIKTDYEKEVMRYATRVTCNAHKSVMAKCKPDMYEYQCEANFLHYAYYVGGCRHVGYNNICCSGMNGAVLHYGHATEPNSKEIHDGDMWYNIIILK